MNAKSEHPSEATMPELRPLAVTTRLNAGQPIIDQRLFAAAGLSNGDDDQGRFLGGWNINGPSLVRVPDWLPPDQRADPEARYYCYFASHYGRVIRLAWATYITGPYHLFQPKHGVLDVTQPITFTNGGQLLPSDCASPDVIIDHEKQEFMLFFHCGRSTNVPEAVMGTGWFDTGPQISYVATSKTGLNFNGGDHVRHGPQPGDGPNTGIKQTALANAYMRVFQNHQHWYAFTNCGPLWRGPRCNEDPWLHPWHQERWPTGQLTGGGNPIWTNLHDNYQRNGRTPERHYAGWDGHGPKPGRDNTSRIGSPRHFAIRALEKQPGFFEIWYTARGEQPESIYRTVMDARPTDFSQWTTATTGDAWVHQRVLMPEMPWEGAERPLTISKSGGERNTNALRDPAIFVDQDKQIYLLYSGGPEMAIGMCKVTYES
jgi:hypothetical protein